MLILEVVANRRNVEKLDVVMEGDPEAAIIGVLQIDLLFCALRPLIGQVAPVTLPFFPAPRVSNLNQPLGLPVVKSYQLCTDQTVSVSVHQADALDRFRRQIIISLTCYGGAHGELQLV